MHNTQGKYICFVVLFCGGPPPHAAPIEVLELRNLDISAGLDQPCILIVQDSHEDVLSFLEADSEVIVITHFTWCCNIMGPMHYSYMI